MIQPEDDRDREVKDVLWIATEETGELDHFGEQIP